jgi:hypothetical protein
MPELPPPDLSPLDEFGSFIVRNLHDSALHRGERLLAGNSRAPTDYQLQSALHTLSSHQRAAVRELLSSSVRTAMHDFLFALQEQADSGDRISVTVRGEDIIAASDGIHGEAYGEDGWFARFSSFFGR